MTSAPMRLSILGATGSIGQNTLRVVEHAPERYRMTALTAQDNVAELAKLAQRFQPEFVAIGNDAHYTALKNALAGTDIRVAAGAESLVEAASMDADSLVAGIVGAAGLAPTYAALQPGKRVLLANKECLVCAGDLFMQRAQESGAVLLPIDSEHNAIFQLLDHAAGKAAIDRIVLTASGGPFRDWSVEQMTRATPEQATNHPTWKMGAKISVDSATMMNKGLEMIEAHYLFGLPEAQIDVVVHPQSIIHGFVHYVDGSTLAHFSATEMTVPIAHALSWPERRSCPQAPLDLTKLATMQFLPPDEARFPALRIARAALRKGAGACLSMNAANEIAVAAFLAGEIGFLQIAELVGQMVERTSFAAPASIADALAMDQACREETAAMLAPQKARA
jgi:1-deoxy-D-xylulose-5-phosphate reductoisomerase